MPPVWTQDPSKTDDFPDVAPDSSVSTYTPPLIVPLRAGTTGTLLVHPNFLPDLHLPSKSSVPLGRLTVRCTCIRLQDTISKVTLALTRPSFRINSAPHAVLSRIDNRTRRAVVDKSVRGAWW